MTSTMTIPRLNRRRTAVPASTSTAARDQRFRTVQLVLFTVGAILMPLGIIAICLGWYGTAHAHYAYDQSTYLISGGILGLGLTFLGGFLYFGAWLAKVASDQRDGARQLSEAMLVLAELLAPQEPAGTGIAGFEDLDELAFADVGAMVVLAGSGTTAHRRDCALIAHRDDLRVLTEADGDVTTCRVCRPVI